MNPIIIDLLDFVEKSTAGSSLHAATEKIGATEVRIVAIKLLGWLKDSARRGRRKPLAFNKDHTWCQNLLVLLTDVPQLDHLLNVQENRIDFRASIPDDERDETEKYVDAQYKPRLRI